MESMETRLLNDLGMNQSCGDSSLNSFKVNVRMNGITGMSVSELLYTADDYFQRHTEDVNTLRVNSGGSWPFVSPLLGHRYKHFRTDLAR